MDTSAASSIMQMLNTQLGVFCFANFVIACCSVTAVAFTSIFLGNLTQMEAGRLTQRLLKFLLIKVALVGMVVLPQGVALLHWLPWLAAIGELKLFVGLSKDRLKSLSVTPAAGLSHHARTLCLLLVLLAANALCMAVLWVVQLRQLSRAVCVLFGLDLAITAVDAANATVSCVALLMDEALAATDAPSPLYGRALAMWECWQGQGRDAVFYHLELGADVAMHALTLVHHLHVWVLHGLSFNLLDALLLLDTRAVLLSIVQRLRLHKRHITATSSIDSAFPDAPQALLAAGEVECVICRERLTAAKQLPCGHMFHLPCLRAWLQQSGIGNFTCPVCRTPMPLPCAAATATAAMGSGTGTSALANQHQLQQQQPDLQFGLSSDAAPAGSELMQRLSFSLSLDELPSTASTEQYRQYMQQLQLYERADSWGGDILHQGMLDSPASDAGLQADMARALAASLQDTGSPAVPSDSQPPSQSSQHSAPSAHDAAGKSSSSAASGSSMADPGNARLGSSSSSSPAGSAPTACQQQQLLGDMRPRVALPPAIFSAAAAAVAAGALDSTDSSDSPFRAGLTHQQYTLDSSGVTGSSNSSYIYWEDETQSDAAERFYSQKYGDPLADSDVATTTVRSPGLEAASRMCRTCSSMLVSLIGRAPSRHSATPPADGHWAAAAVPTASASAPCTPAGPAAAEATVEPGHRTSSSCSRHSSNQCRRRHRHKHCKQQHDVPCCAHGTSALDGAGCKGFRQQRHEQICQSSCSHQQVGSDQPQQQEQQNNQAFTTVAGLGAAATVTVQHQRALPEKFAVLRLDTAPASDQADTPEYRSAPAAGAAATATEPAAAAAAAQAATDATLALNGGAEGACADSGAEDELASAAAAAYRLITSPRDPCRRRDEGRWGRRRLLAAPSPAAGRS